MKDVKAGLVGILIGLLSVAGCGDQGKEREKGEVGRDAGVQKAKPKTVTEPAHQKIVVSNLKICQEIRSRTPIKVGTRFPKTVRQLYCFSEIRAAEEPTTISHIWYYKGKMMADVTLSVDYERMRTWSSKNIQSDWVGEWQVYVVSAHGNVLDSIEFTIE